MFCHLTYVVSWGNIQAEPLQCFILICCHIAVRAGRTEVELARLYQELETFQSDPSAPVDMEMLKYNLNRGTECSGPVGPGPEIRACPIDTGYNYELTVNICYKRLYSTNRSGKDTCIEEGGSDLLTVDTQEKQDFFGSLVPGIEYTYIRGDRIPSTGQWAYWEEGTTSDMPFIDWSPGQPNGATRGQDCMALDSTGQHDASCDYLNYFFCEYYL